MQENAGAAADGLEQIIGPVFGYHLACYTVERAEGHYGYAKLCPTPPAGVWDTPGAVAKLTAGPFADPHDALVAVVSRARRKLERRVGSPWRDADEQGFILLDE